MTNVEGKMENGNGTLVEIASTQRRKAAPRKASTGARKDAARRKPAAKRKKATRRTSFEKVIESITGSVAVARAAIAEASGQGAIAVRRTLGDASVSSRRTITRLAKEWNGMDPKKKARVLAALLGAAAAVSAPLVRRRFKK
ncbi:MAG: hypothetical protein ABI968_01165 [Acidobacteriota bacterium]